jgi:hypothetical protein
MLKKAFLAAAVALIFAGTTVTVAPTEAYACKSGCFKKAKASYGHHWKARHAYRKACHAHYKAWKKAHKH